MNNIRKPLKIDGFFVLPESKALPLLEGINNAKKNIDISVFHIGSKQIGDCLIRALERNVNIRIMVNFEFQYDKCESLLIKKFIDYINQNIRNSDLLSNINYFWSSPKFLFSKQRFILIDHKNNDNDFQFTEGITKCFILTGDLLSNNNMYTKEETSFYSKRDFQILLYSPRNKHLIESIYKSFSADLNNAPYLLSQIEDSFPLIWSNGMLDAETKDWTVNLAKNNFSSKKFLSQGNAFEEILTLINNSTQKLIITTKGISSIVILKALSSALKRGVTIIILADKKNTVSFKNLYLLCSLGAEIFLISQDSVFQQNAEYIICDHELALIGTISLTDESLFENKELSVLTDSLILINTLYSTFYKDLQHLEVYSMKIKTLEDIIESKINKVDYEQLEFLEE